MDIELFETESIKSDALRDFQNPFHKDCVDYIEFKIERGMFDKTNIEFKATVRFRNKNAVGYHYVNAANFPELIKRVEEFIKEI